MVLGALLENVSIEASGSCENMGRVDGAGRFVGERVDISEW